MGQYISSTYLVSDVCFSHYTAQRDFFPFPKIVHVNGNNFWQEVRDHILILNTASATRSSHLPEIFGELAL
jgi:hypothetical protein